MVLEHDRLAVTARVDAMIAERSLLKHPFYQRWTAGTLTMEELRKYAVQYYAFESALPRVLSILLSRSKDRDHRQALLENLWDEEHGRDNHAELWLRFAEGLGLRRDQVIGADPTEATRDLVERYERVARDEPVGAGVAALYAYESQVPQVASAKLRGLPQYGVDPAASTFFDVHAGLDVEHSAAERRIIQDADPADEAAVVEAAGRALEGWWAFLDGVQPVTTAEP